MGSGAKQNKPSNPQPVAPTPQGSAVYNGNQLVSQTSYDPKMGMVTRYTPDPSTQQMQQNVLGQINQLVPTFGQTDSQMQNQYNKTAQDWEDQQLAAFNRMYDPSLRNLREDVASRFGTTQATPYYDQLNQLEQNVRVPALLNISQTGTQMAQQLAQQGENNKINELQSLGYMLNGQQNNFLNNLQNTQNSSNALNNFDLNQYQNALNNYQFNKNFGLQQQVANANSTAAMMGGIGNLAGGVIGGFVK